MILVVIFGAIPFFLGLVIEYLICRFLKRGLWRVLPPLLLALLGAGVAVYRHHMWASDAAIWTQLILVPGVPVTAALLGMLIGWRIWRHLWRPRLIWEKKKE